MTVLSLAPKESTLEAGGYVKGVATAVVTENQDDEGLGRVKVRFPWHLQSQQSYWARIAVPMSGKEFGVYFLPEVGQEVLCLCEREDIRFPIVIGGVFNGKEPPPAKNDGNNDKRLIRSRKGHELLFDDGKKGLVELKLNDGKKLAIDDNGIRIEDGKGNQLKIESSSGGMTIEAAGSLTIKAKTIAMQSSGTCELKAGATMTVKGTLVQIN